MRNSCSIAEARCFRSGRGRCARPYSVFCSTDKCGKSASSCKTYPTPRFATGTLMREFVSNKTRSPTVIRPVSGVATPATQSSRVVFPDPDAPNNMVKPGSAVNSTSRENSRSGERKVFPMPTVSVRFAEVCSRDMSIESRLPDRTHRPHSLIRSAVPPINHSQHSETEYQQQQPHSIGRRIVPVLHLIVNADRDRPGHAGNVASNHQHHSKLAHGMSKRQDDAGEQSRHG